MKTLATFRRNSVEDRKGKMSRGPEYGSRSRDRSIGGEGFREQVIASDRNSQVDGR